MLKVLVGSSESSVAEVEVGCSKLSVLKAAVQAAVLKAAVAQRSLL